MWLTYGSVLCSVMKRDTFCNVCYKIKYYFSTCTGCTHMTYFCVGKYIVWYRKGAILNQYFDLGPQKD